MVDPQLPSRERREPDLTKRAVQTGKARRPEQSIQSSPSSLSGCDGPPDSAVVQDLHQQTARIAWSALQRFFAAGRVLWVAPHLDLVTVAAAFAADDALQVQDWMNRAELRTPRDAEALLWHDRDALLWAVVVAPVVLVQELAQGE